MAKEKAKKYTGPKRYVEYKEAEGRTVQFLRYWHSPRDGQAVVIQFTDGMRIHLGLDPVLRVQTEVSVLRDGDLHDVEKYPPILGARIP
jgi:hypothetical protein